jgi:hypothetical protein
MDQKTWISFLLVSFLILPMLRDCCVPTLQSPMPNCPHQSSEPNKSSGSCPGLNANATIEKQIDLTSLALMSIEHLSGMLIKPPTLRGLRPERAVYSSPPLPNYSNILLI